MAPPTPALPAGAVDAAAAGRLAIFAGAGLSMAPPSYVPDWLGFNRLLLDAIKASALDLPGLSAPVSEAVRGLAIEQLDTQAFSNLVVQSFAGDSYFPVLNLLDSDRPNAYHRALATLAGAGRCGAIVTTNFDTLIERACADAQVQAQVVATVDDFRRPAPSGFALYKIHGTATVTASMVDTVSQKLRGLPFPVRARLTSVFNAHHLLVLGFSGADIAFDPDYIPLASVAAGGAGGLTWVVGPDRRIHPDAAAIVRSIGGSIVEASLEDVFRALGVNPAPVVPPNAQLEEQVQARARDRVAQWLKALEATPLQCGLFCLDVFRNLGRAGQAEALIGAIADVLSRAQEAGGLPIHALVSYHAFAIVANERGNYPLAEHWCQRGLGVYRAATLAADTMPEPLHPDARRDLNGQLIGLSLALARALAGQRKIDEARDALARGARWAEEIGDATLVSSAYIIGATLEPAGLSEASDREAAIEEARRAWTRAARAGAAVEMAQAASLEARELMMIGEYDAALAAVGRANRGARWSGAGLARMLPAVLPAVIAARRGQDDDALALFQDSIRQSIQDPFLHTRLTLAFVLQAGGRPALRLRLRPLLDGVLAAMDAGAVISDGSNPLLLSRAEVLRIRDQDDTACPGPLFENFTLAKGVPAEELERRTLLLRAELAADRTMAARILLSLAKGRYNQTAPRRMGDLADAARIVAERAGDHATRLEALQLTGVARDLAGDLKGAAMALQAVLAATPPASPALRTVVSSNLGLVLAQLGRVAEAEPLLRARAEHAASTGNVAERARAIIALADALAGPQPERAQALLTDTVAAVDATGEEEAIKKRDAILASVRRKLTRRPSAGLPVLWSRPHPTASFDRIRSLAAVCESPSEQCDVAERALQSGHISLAVPLIREAQAKFRDDGDVGQVARSFHLLADAAQIEGRWDSALDYTRLAMQLHLQQADLAAQGRTLATLALQFAMTEDPAPALNAAGQMLARDQPGPVSRFTLAALYGRARATRLKRQRLLAWGNTRRVRTAIEIVEDIPRDSPFCTWLRAELA